MQILFGKMCAQVIVKLTSAWLWLTETFFFSKTQKLCLFFLTLPRAAPIIYREANVGRGWLIIVTFCAGSDRHWSHLEINLFSRWLSEYLLCDITHRLVFPEAWYNINIAHATNMFVVPTVVQWDSHRELVHGQEWQWAAEAGALPGEVGWDGKTSSCSTAIVGPVTTATAE